MNHTHVDPERLTVGCAACIQRVEQARWDGAPLRRITLRAIVPRYVATINGRTIDWTFTIDGKVPDGVTKSDIEDADIEALFDVGVELVESMPRIDDDDEAMDAIATATLSITRIDDIEPERQPEPNLFGGIA